MIAPPHTYLDRELPVAVSRLCERLQPSPHLRLTCGAQLSNLTQTNNSLLSFTSIHIRQAQLFLITFPFWEPVEHATQYIRILHYPPPFQEWILIGTDTEHFLSPSISFHAGQRLATKVMQFRSSISIFLGVISAHAATHAQQL